MASPTPVPIEVRLTAWRRVWEALLAEPPTERAPEQLEPAHAPDSDAGDEAT